MRRPRRSALLAAGGAVLLLALLLLLPLVGKGGSGEEGSRGADTSPYGRATEFVYGGSLGPRELRRGRTLRRDGTVEVWEADSDHPDQHVVRERFRVDPERAEAVFRAAKEARFLQIPTGTEGSAGLSMTLVWSEGRHRVSWQDGRGPRALTPISKAFGLAMVHRRR